jgi:hypothetical protein
MPGAEYNNDMAHRKNPYAVALGKRGARIRYAQMTPEERRTLARKAALTRWQKYQVQKKLEQQRQRRRGRFLAVLPRRLTGRRH